MNKYWSKTFQDTVGRTVNGLSDSAAKFKQNWNEKPLSLDTSSAINSPDPSSPDRAGQEKTQYLRLPVESARKLRWFDREDIDSLVEASARDKKLLHATISALRQKLQDAGIDHAVLDEDLDRRLKDVSSLAEHDEAVSSVLLVSLQEEVRILRDQFQAGKTHSLESTSRSEQQDARRADDPAVQLQIVIRANEVPAQNKNSSSTPTPSSSNIAQLEPSPEEVSLSNVGGKENEVMDALLG